MSVDLSGVRATPVLGQGMTSAQVLQVAQALEATTTSEGWQVFVALIERLKISIGLYGIRDEKTTKEYYAGQLDILDTLLAQVSDLLSFAKEQREKEKTIQKIVSIRGGEPAGLE